MIPFDVQVMRDGALLVSDDRANAIYPPAQKTTGSARRAPWDSSQEVAFFS